MSVVLHDPTRVRALERACRRAWRSSLRARWQRARSRWRARSRPILLRMALTGLVALLGLFVEEQPLAAHVLALYGVILMQARINQLRTALYGDAALATLAQLPIPHASILAYQLRERARPVVWAALDAAAFWSTVWATQEREGWLWLWLPVIALGYAFITEALALLLLQRWRTFDVALFGALLVTVWTLASWDEQTWLWHIVASLLETLGWLTPWGWLSSCAARAPDAPVFGAPLTLLAIAAAYLAAWSSARLSKTWALHSGWHEVAGVPMHALRVADAKGAAIDVEEPPSADAADDGHAAAANTADHEKVALDALTRARSVEAGHSVLGFGWPGRFALTRFSDVERVLIDRLVPQGTGPVQWRWALLLAALPAAGAVAGLSPYWPMAVLALILLLRRLSVAAVMLLGMLGGTLLWPGFTPFLCIVLPCVCALLLSMPMGGGTWVGLPMSVSVLGSAPRSWARLMRVMLLLNGLRFIAGIPVVVCVAIAMGFGLSRPAGAAVAVAYAVFFVAMPSVIAMKLIQRRPNNVDMSLGRAWLTLSSTLLLVIHAFASVFAVVGAAVATEYVSKGAVISGVSLALAIVAAALQIALLRHAYRRTIDFVAA